MRFLMAICLFIPLSVPAWSGNYDGKYEGTGDVESGPCDNFVIEFVVKNGEISGLASNHLGEANVTGLVSEDGAFTGLTVEGFATAVGKIANGSVSGTWENDVSGCAGTIDLTE